MHRQKYTRLLVTSAMMYGADAWAVKKAQENKFDVVEIRIEELLRNGRIRRTTEEMSKKVQESRFKGSDM